MADLSVNETSDINEIYNEFLSRIENAAISWELEDLKREIVDNPHFKEMTDLIRLCDKKIEKINNAQKENDYNFAIDRYEKAKSEREFESLKTLFQKLGDFRDSAYYVSYCDARIEEIRALEKKDTVQETVSSDISSQNNFDTEASASDENNYNTEPSGPVENNSAVNTESTVNVSSSESISGKAKFEPDFDEEPITEFDYSKVRNRKSWNDHERKVKSAELTANMVRLIVEEAVYLTIGLGVFSFGLLMILITFVGQNEAAIVLTNTMLIIAFIFCLIKVIFPPLCFIPAWRDIEAKIPGLRDIADSENSGLQIGVRLGIQFAISFAFWSVWFCVLVVGLSFT